MLARIADGGGVLAVILLCQSSEQYFTVTGWMAACITLPHMLGPFIAHRIDTASDGRRVTLAARSEYTPLSCRGQIFLWVGAMKITAGSLGTAAAGQLMLLGAYTPLILSLCTLSAILVISLVARTRP